MRSRPAVTCRRSRWRWPSGDSFGVPSRRPSEMMTRLSSPVVVTGIVVGLIIGGADLVAGHQFWQAALGLATPVAYGIVATLVGIRSETVSVLAGRPVDERWQHINLVASTWAFGASAI